MLRKANIISLDDEPVSQESGRRLVRSQHPRGTVAMLVEGIAGPFIHAVRWLAFARFSLPFSDKAPRSGTIQQGSVMEAAICTRLDTKKPKMRRLPGSSACWVFTRSLAIGSCCRCSRLLDKSVKLMQSMGKMVGRFAPQSLTKS